MELTIQHMMSHIDTYGAFAVFSAMLLTGIGLPLPGELTLGLTGYLVASGQLALLPSITAAALGDILGAAVCYKLGAVGRTKIVTRYVAFLIPTEATLMRMENWLANYGILAVVFGRVLPVIRGAVPISAGFAQMEEKSYMIGIAGSSLLWCSALIFLGMMLGYNWQQIVGLANSVGIVAAGVLVAAVLTGYLIFLRKKLK